jgi:UDP-N-acetylmuramyl pentapeptide phosphotransferase/UDP-N-acetylglucosamine-1-phosphate transferase
MDPLVGAIVWFVLFATIGAVGTWIARRYALLRQLLDQPGERRSHRIATPRGGGIAIALAFLVAITAMILRQPIEIVLLACAGVGLILVAGIGWVDDHRPLSPWSRLAVHAIAAGCLAVGFYLSGRSGNIAMTVFILSLVLVNVWNFMDGIDGLAASQAVLVAAVLAYSTGGSLAVHLGLALIAATFGFLPFNFPRANIFLGDVGSGALGFALALLLGLWLDTAPFSEWPLVFLPLSAFLLDAGLTLSTRIMRGDRWWRPHVEHAYQRWSRQAGSHVPVTAAYAVWTLSAAGSLVWLKREAGEVITLALMAWLIMGSGVWYWLRRRSVPSDVEKETSA